MMHVVLFKFDAEKLAAEFPNGIQESVDVMKKEVPGVWEITMNERNLSPWEGYVDSTQGYTHCLVSKHDDGAALKVYEEHPVHNAFRSRLLRCITAPPLRVEMTIPMCAQHD